MKRAKERETKGRVEGWGGVGGGWKRGKSERKKEACFGCDA